MSEDLRRQVLTYLKIHNVLTLATAGPDGPWAAALFYVSDGFELYWLSDPDTRHSLNIAHNPRVSVAIHEDYRDWQSIQGIQMEGAAELVGSIIQAIRPMRLYAARYPFLGDLRNPPPALAKALATTRVYRFTPTRVYFIDNAQGLGHREEVVLAGDRPTEQTGLRSESDYVARRPVPGPSVYARSRPCRPEDGPPSIRCASPKPHRVDKPATCVYNTG